MPTNTTRENAVRDFKLQIQKTPKLRFGSTAIDYVDLDLLELDEAYQTPIRQKKTAALAENWNIDKVGLLEVNIRDNNHIYTIDGGHRSKVAMNKGLTALPAKIHIGLTQAEEAKIFAEQQDNVAKLTPEDTFTAHLLYGEPIDTAINTIAQRYNYCVAHNACSVPKGKYQLKSIGACRTIVTDTTINGEDCLEEIFRLFAVTNWTAEKDHCASTWMLALLKVYKDALNGTLLKRIDLPPVSLEEAWANLTIVMSRFGEKQLATCASAMYSHAEKRGQSQRLINDIAAGRKTFEDVSANCDDTVGLSSTKLVIV